MELSRTAARLGRFAARRLWSHLRGHAPSNVSRDISDLFGGGAASSATLPILAMGRDIRAAAHILESESR